MPALFPADIQLGPVHEFTSRFDRYRPLPAGHAGSGSWKETPGQHNEAIYNLGSHIIDQAVVLFGVPERVACRNVDERGVGLDEAFEMTLLYPPQPGGTGPLAVHLGASILRARPRLERFVATGARGSFVKYGLDPQEAFLRAGKRVADAGYGVEAPAAYGTLELCADDGTWSARPVPSEQGWYPAIYESMHRAIVEKNPALLGVQPEQAIWTMRLIELGNQASREGRVMDVPRE